MNEDRFGFLVISTEESLLILVVSEKRLLSILTLPVLSACFHELCHRTVSLFLGNAMPFSSANTP